VFRQLRPHPLLVLLAFLPDVAAAQALGPTTTGPVVEGYGPVFEVVGPTFVPPEGATFHAVFDVSTGAEDASQLNRRIETVARYLNMHAQAGVPAERVRAALVVHGSAGKDLLDDEGYRRRHGVANPNAELVRRLISAGVDVVLCGQTQMSRGLRREELIDGVRVGLSAMTALIVYQSEGYALIPS